ncbi:MAG: exopolysaccharide transport family protein [Hyphomicrobiaceae bacterium]
MPQNLASDTMMTEPGPHAHAYGSVPPAPMWDIRDIVSILWRRLAWLILPALLLASAAVAYVLIVPPRYDAKVTLLIDPRGLQVTDRTIEPNRNSGEESLALVESQVRVLTSDATLQRLIEREGLVADDEFGRPPAGVFASVKGWLAGLVGRADRQADPRLATLERLRRAVRAERAAGSYIVDLYVRSRDPAKAARLANAIADIFIAEDRAVRSSASGRVGNELSIQLEGLKRQVQDAERRIEAFKTENGLVSARGNLINEQKLAEVANQLVQARLKTQEAQARVDQITAALKAGSAVDAIGDPIASPTISALRVRLAAARQLEAQLLATLRPAHPSVQAAQASIRSISGQIRSELARIAETSRAELARAKGTESQVAASEDRLRRDVERASAATVQLRELERERDSLRKVYEGFLVRARELGGQSSIDTSNSRIYSRATPPQQKSGPGLGVLVAGTLAAGLVIGTLLALLAEQLAAAVPAVPVRATARTASSIPSPPDEAPAPPPSVSPRISPLATTHGSNQRPVTTRRVVPVRPANAPLSSREPAVARRDAGAPRAVHTNGTDEADVVVMATPRSAGMHEAAAGRAMPRRTRTVQFEPPTEATQGIETAARPAARPRFRPTMAFRRVPLIGTVGMAGFPSDAVRDIVFADPGSEDADAFFSAAFLLANGTTAGARVVVVTASEGARASALGAFNLALASAASGERVLLVDADLAQRRLSRTLVPAAVRGLADVTEGALSLADVTWNDPDTFDLVPASGLLRRRVATDRLAHTIARIAGEAEGYSRVIVDAGALTGSESTAERLARAADAVVLMTEVAVAAEVGPIVRPQELDAAGDAVIGAIAVRLS